MKSAVQWNTNLIVIAHDGFLDAAKAKSPNGEKVVSIFEKYPGTVILAINGHYHTDHFLRKTEFVTLILIPQKWDFPVTRQKTTTKKTKPSPILNTRMEKRFS